MFFPWIGLLEQIRLADAFVFYDDVAFSKGGFQNRVQYKAADGARWLTVPLAETALGQAIRDVRINQSRNWKRKHLDSLAQAYARAPHRERMLSIVEQVYAEPHEHLGALSTRSMEALCMHLGLAAGRRFLRASELGVAGRGSERVLAIVRALGGDHYVTGWGARDYLDHAAFERNGVRVSYMAYERRPYPQQHGEFDPHVSALDALANCGDAAAALVCSGAVDWQEFLRGQQ